MSNHGAAKSESENPGYNIIFEIAERENNFEVEKDGRKDSVILNHANSNRINTNLDYLNYSNSNQLLHSD